MQPVFTFHHSVWSNITSFVSTLVVRQSLLREGYYYVLLEGTSGHINYKLLANILELELKKYNLSSLSLPKYRVYLQRFGTFGCYAAPNKIYVTVSRTPEEISHTIIHEAIHLDCENHVKRNKLTQNEKEELVSSLESKIRKR